MQENKKAETKVSANQDRALILEHLKTTIDALVLAYRMGLPLNAAA